jgi:hypothetical protein
VNPHYAAARHTVDLTGSRSTVDLFHGLVDRALGPPVVRGFRRVAQFDVFYANDDDVWITDDQNVAQFLAILSAWRHRWD